MPIWLAAEIDSPRPAERPRAIFLGERTARARVARRRRSRCWHKVPVERDARPSFTQRQLAKHIGVAEQQVQCWEACNYRGVNLDRLQDSADALGVQMHDTITYSSAA